MSKIDVESIICPRCGYSQCYREHPVTCFRPGEEPVVKVYYGCTGGCKIDYNKNKTSGGRLMVFRFSEERS